jgi:dolichol-phosphate mannosyltransferase
MMHDLSIVIPTHNEEKCIELTVTNLTTVLERETIDYEIVIVNDNSKDKTPKIIERIASENFRIKPYNNTLPNGFGRAVRCGIEKAQGEWVAVMMADASDDPEDLIRFFHEALSSGNDAVFGNRFLQDGRIVDYPLPKLLLNRLTNWLICLLFTISYTDVTNAFKLYRKSTLEGLKPFLSPHFNLTVELALKVIVRGYSYSVLPNSWHHRKEGQSKLKIKEMGSRYWFIIFYCLIEKWLSVGDYRK